jgi:hypothetical protein
VRPGRSATSPASDTTGSDAFSPNRAAKTTTIAATTDAMSAPPNSDNSSRSRLPRAKPIATPTTSPTGSAAIISAAPPPRNRAAPDEKSA